MEVYILDSLLRREQVVDDFESLIWTERYSAYGDFELKIHSNLQNRKRFVEGVRLAINASYRVMTVRTVENNTDTSGQEILTVKGSSLEQILEDRLAMTTVIPPPDKEPVWMLTGTPAAIARKMFEDICVTGTLSIRDKIPFVQPGSIFPPDNIVEPPFSITLEQSPDTLYSAIKSLCDMYDLGFRLIRNFDTSKLYFNIYSGSTRTSAQTTLPAVVFSADMDNLQNTTSLSTSVGAKNVAYVISPAGRKFVYPEGVDPDVEGFERRLLLVEASDITTEKDGATRTATEIDQLLTQKGKEELSKYRTYFAFDGEIDPNSNYRYGVHYNLGDMVEVRNKDGEVSNMRVTEQIFVADLESERSYPTLTLSQYINPGTWLAWDYNQVWADLGSEAWADA